MKKFFLMALVITIMGGISHAQELKDRIKFSGLMYGDYFYNFNNVDGKLKSYNGFQFRRIYFTNDFIVSDNFDTRLRLETDQTINSNTPGGKLGVMIKDAYLKWKEIFNGSDMVFGISPTPAFDISESAWGYRSIEKTIMDLNGIVSSRDFGVDLKGRLTNDRSLNYWVKAANNSSNSPEPDKYDKRYYALLQFKPLQGFQSTVYFDYATRTEIKDPVDKINKPNNSWVGSLFLNYQLRNEFALGFEGFFRNTQNGFAPNAVSLLQNQKSIGYSFWAWLKLAEKFNVVARYDRFDSNIHKGNDAANLFLAGIEYKAAKNVSIIPNFEVTTYQIAPDLNGSTSKSNMVGRVTFAFTF
jgi:hypothetical protein